MGKPQIVIDVDNCVVYGVSSPAPDAFEVVVRNNDVGIIWEPMKFTIHQDEADTAFELAKLTRLSKENAASKIINYLKKQFGGI